MNPGLITHRLVIFTGRPVGRIPKKVGMNIQFCGAAGEVTGSAHLLTLNDGTRILLDCGMFQGSREWEQHNNEWLFDPADIGCLVLSHAHIDHSGRIPQLVRDGFRGPIHATHATRSLCSIMLLDSARIQEKDAEHYNKRQLRKSKHERGNLRTPLYTTKDADQAMNLFRSYGYDKWVRIHDDVEILFRDAGHILGSASVTLRIRENGRIITLGFSGDVGRPNRPILRDPQPMPEVDYLICESTYGDRDHEGAPEELERLLSIIRHTCLEKKGKLIIPAFAIGRVQEVVYLLDRLEHDGRLPKIPVYVDSPLAVNATTIFGAHPECFDHEINEYLLTDENPFGFNSLVYVKDVEVSKRLNESREPCIIISSSGMMEAGRILHHLAHSVDNERNTFLLVGYCSPGTPCSQLREGKPEIRIFGEDKPVRAEVLSMESFSAHADRRELLDFVRNQRDSAHRVYLVHGSSESRQAFRKLLLGEGFKEVLMPGMGEKVELD